MDEEEDLLKLIDDMLGRERIIKPEQRRLSVQRAIDVVQLHIDACKRNLIEGDLGGEYRLIGVFPATRKDLEAALASYEAELVTCQQKLAAIE